MKRAKRQPQCPVQIAVKQLSGQPATRFAPFAASDANLLIWGNGQMNLTA